MVKPSPLQEPRNAKETNSVSAFFTPQQRCPSRKRTDRPRTSRCVSKSFFFRYSPSSGETHRGAELRVADFAGLAEEEFSYLTDILVADLADLLDIGGGLGDVLERVAGQDKLILLGGRNDDIDTLGHGDAVDDLLADEVADLNLEEAGLLVLLQVDVDGKMGVDVAHLVLEALGDTDNHVVNDGANGAQGSDVLAVAMVDLDGDGVLGGVAEADGQVTEVSDELAYSSNPVRGDIQTS